MHHTVRDSRGLDKSLELVVLQELVEIKEGNGNETTELQRRFKASYVVEDNIL
jgi:hypothetical protein